MAEDKKILGLTPEQVEKELKLLENQYKMYNKTLKDTERNMKNKLDEQGKKMYSKEDIEKHLELIRFAQNDTVEKYGLLGGDTNKLKSGAKKNKIGQIGESALDLVKNYDEERVEISMSKPYVEEEHDLFSAPVFEEAIKGEGFDLIPIPSKGECYKTKFDRLPVASLVANDENMIVSPNLYKSNMLIDYILKAKIKTDAIDPMDMLEGDREAVILYLRRDAYGDEYPIKATDEKTGQKYETVIDLRELTYRPFNLKADENGWFDFTLPVTKHEIKFRFLTHRDNLRIKKASELEEKKLVKENLIDIVSTLDDYIEADEILDKNSKVKVRQAIRDIENWQERIEEEDSIGFTHELTNRLELAIMSVDGNTDRNDIRNFVKTMKPKDALELRRYIAENEPGIDYEFTVTKPADLGGGSTTVFLQFDQYVFFNV